MLIDEDQKRWMGVALEAAAQRAVLDYGREGPEVERSLKSMAHALKEGEALIPRTLVEAQPELGDVLHSIEYNRLFGPVGGASHGR